MTPDMEFKYEILQLSSLKQLAKKTEEMLNDHYQVVGPIVPVTEPNGAPYFIQGMVQAKFKNPTAEEQPSEDDIAKADETVTQKLADNMGKYTKDLLEINGLRLACEKGQVVLYRKTKNLGAVSGSALLSELRTAKHAPVDLDGNKVLNELDDAIVKALGVAQDEN